MVVAVGPLVAHSTLLNQIQYAVYEFTGYGGTGSNGALVVSGVPNGPTNPLYTDSVRTYLTAAAAASATTITVNSAASFTVGDEIIIIQMLGTGAGAYETRTITSKTATTISFTGGLANSYPSYAAGTSVTQVIRVPQYTTVTLNSGGFLTVSPFDGQTGGVMFFRSSGGITINYNATMSGTISVKGKGYTGGSVGAGGSGPAGGAVGFGGGNTTPGNVNYTVAGSGGGGSASASGGAGGGIMILKTSGTMTVDGVIDASGNNAGGTNAAGGAGGTLVIFANSITTSSTCGQTTVAGGNGNGSGTAGADGRAFIHFENTLNCTNATPASARSYRKYRVR